MRAVTTPIIFLNRAQLHSKHLTMADEKDDFLREIDELLGDIDEDPIPPITNGSTAEGVEQEHHQPAPKTG